MPPTRPSRPQPHYQLPYDGTSRRTSKGKGTDKRPVLTAEEKKQRKEQRIRRRRELHEGVARIKEDKKAAAEALAKSTGQSSHLINVLVGTETTLKKTRRANAYNAWASLKMAEVNSSKSCTVDTRRRRPNFFCVDLPDDATKYTLKTFKIAYADEYKHLTPEEKADYKQQLQDIKDQQPVAPPTKRKVGQAAQADITATTNAIVKMVS